MEALQVWLVVYYCLAGASGPICTDRVFPEPMTTPYACTLFYMQHFGELWQPGLPPPNPRCAMGKRPDLLPLRLVPDHFA